MAQYPSALQPSSGHFCRIRNLKDLPSSRRFLSRIPRSKVDPGRPSGSSPNRFLCVGFWGVKTIAICMSRDNGAVSSFRECGLPCGLRGALCTLHLCRSVCTSFTGATLGMSGGLDLAQQGLPPGKKRQASLGALTLRLSRRSPTASFRIHSEPLAGRGRPRGDG